MYWLITTTTARTHAQHMNMLPSLFRHGYCPAFLAPIPQLTPYNWWDCSTT